MATTPAVELSLEQRTALRCSAAFAIVSTAQEQGGASDYPRLDRRAREFFVRSSARVMDEAGLDREGITALMEAEAQDLVGTPGRIDAVMPACLALLDASGL
jgi:hypothetical protein